MGGLTSSINKLTKTINNLYNFNQKSKVSICMEGLGCSGKTSIMYKLKYDEVTKTIPTAYFNVETFEHKSLLITLWDIGSQNGIKELKKHYYEKTDCLIYVVDSSNSSSIDLAREDLINLLNEDSLKSVELLVVANKQDVSGALRANEIVDRLSLNQIKDREWKVIGTSVLKGNNNDDVGIYEGLNWIENRFQEKQNKLSAK